MTALDKMLGEVEEREWFAVKRTEKSVSYQFYVPHRKARETIKAIAPEGGNFEEICLVEKSSFDRVCAALREAVKQRDHWVGCAIMAPFEIERTIEEENQLITQILKGEK